ncbi:hypothetical protein, partial [Rhizobium leguminosarum]|uniref:hypothetical protein n=1 Tax=Rhizobium leguminosarum TaxID=384 RepID=UPI003F9A1A33
MLESAPRTISSEDSESKSKVSPPPLALAGARILTTIDGIPIPYISNSSRKGAFAPANANGGGDTFDFDSLSSLD